MSTRCHTRLIVDVFVEMDDNLAKGQESLSDLVRDAFAPSIADHIASANVKGMPVDQITITAFRKIILDRKNLYTPRRPARPQPLRRGIMDAARRAAKAARSQ